MDLASEFWRIEAHFLESHCRKKNHSRRPQAANVVRAKSRRRPEPPFIMRDNRPPTLPDSTPNGGQTTLPELCAAATRFSLTVARAAFFAEPPFVLLQD